MFTNKTLSLWQRLVFVLLAAVTTLWYHVQNTFGQGSGRVRQDEAQQVPGN